ncbi:MAG: hypothetical protein NXI10_12845 [bacterium]|nr:hypothetical protein [bacterium]
MSTTLKKEITASFTFPEGSVGPFQEGTYAPLLHAFPYQGGSLIRAIVFCDPTSLEPEFGPIDNVGGNQWTGEISYKEPVSQADGVQVWYLEYQDANIPADAEITINQSGGPKTSRGTVVVSQSSEGEIENK